MVQKHDPIIFLADPTWRFQLVPDGATDIDYYLLWPFKLEVPLKEEEVLTSYSLSSAYASSTRISIDYEFRDPETFGLSPRDCEILKRFTEEEDQITTKIIWVRYQKENGLVTQLTFYLKIADLGLD